MIIGPATAVWCTRQLFPRLVDNDFLCEALVAVCFAHTVANVLLPVIHVYPSLFTAAGVIHGILTCSKVLATWSQGIRDKEFLVEMRLRNLEPGQVQDAKDTGLDPIEDEEEEI